MRTNTSANPLIIGSTCLVFELQDEKHVAIKLCISTIVVCNYFVLYARSFLAYLYPEQNQLIFFCAAKQNTAQACRTIRWMQSKAEKKQTIWATEDVEMHNVYLNQNQVIFKDNFFIQYRVRHKNNE